MWLFEGERRAESMTASAAGPRCNTQASNFSFPRRSGAPPFMNTASIPNCLKQSDNSEPGGSLILTRRTRAEVFLPERGGANAIPEAFCMALGNALTNYILGVGPDFGKGEEGQWPAQKSHYPE